MSNFAGGGRFSVAVDRCARRTGQKRYAFQRGNDVVHQEARKLKGRSDDHVVNQGQHFRRRAVLSVQVPREKRNRDVGIAEAIVWETTNMRVRCQQFVA